MKLPRLWIILGILGVLAGILLYIIRVLLGDDHWCWDGFLSLETAVSILGFVGVALLVVVVVEQWWKR